MIGLAELRLDVGDAVGALEAAKRGIKFVFDRNKVRVWEDYAALGHVHSEEQVVLHMCWVWRVCCWWSMRGAIAISPRA